MGVETDAWLTDKNKNKKEEVSGSSFPQRNRQHALGMVFGERLGCLIVFETLRGSSFVTAVYTLPNQEEEVRSGC